MEGFIAIAAITLLKEINQMNFEIKIKSLIKILMEPKSGNPKNSYFGQYEIIMDAIEKLYLDKCHPVTL